MERRALKTLQKELCCHKRSRNILLKITMCRETENANRANTFQPKLAAINRHNQNFMRLAVCSSYISHANKKCRAEGLARGGGAVGSPAPPLPDRTVRGAAPWNTRAFAGVWRAYVDTSALDVEGKEKMEDRGMEW